MSFSVTTMSCIQELKYTVSDIAYIGTKIILSRCFSDTRIFSYSHACEVQPVMKLV